MTSSRLGFSFAWDNRSGPGARSRSVGAAVSLLPTPQKSSGLDVMLIFWVQSTQLAALSGAFTRQSTRAAWPEDASPGDWHCGAALSKGQYDGSLLLTHILRIGEWFSDCYLTACCTHPISTFKTNLVLTTLSRRDLVSQETVPFEISLLELLGICKMFHFYTTIFKEPLEKDVRQWIGPHVQIQLSAFLVFVFNCGIQVLFRF